jgi:hypothetical protein
MAEKEEERERRRKRKGAGGSGAAECAELRKKVRREQAQMAKVRDFLPASCIYRTKGGGVPGNATGGGS